MIFCKDKIYAKVWKVVKNDKYLDLQITTSEKDRDGNYVNSGWFPRVIGHAFNSMKDVLKEGDRIVITKSKFTNERYTAKDGSTKSSFRFLILEASIISNDGESGQGQSDEGASGDTATNQTKDDSPW